MKPPEYITIDEVKRVCHELNISDWTAMREASVPSAEAGYLSALKLIFRSLSFPCLSQI